MMQMIPIQIVLNHIVPDIILGKFSLKLIGSAMFGAIFNLVTRVGML